MTPQERDLLDLFLADLTGARPGPKDAEAADRIERALRANPDASYVLVQHAILSDQALQDAQGRIAELEQQLGPPQGQGGSFLGGGYGQGAPQGYGPGGYAQGGGYPPPQATALPPTGGGLFGGGGPGPFSGGGGLGNFLRSAGTTAAGVAGGAFLFEGLSGMFGGHHGGGYGFGGGGENVTVNEFGGGDDRQGFADAGDGDMGGGADFDYDNG